MHGKRIKFFNKKISLCLLLIVNFQRSFLSYHEIWGFLRKIRVSVTPSPPPKQHRDNILSVVFRTASAIMRLRSIRALLAIRREPLLITHIILMALLIVSAAILKLPHTHGHCLTSDNCHPILNPSRLQNEDTL